MKCKWNNIRWVEYKITSYTCKFWTNLNLQWQNNWSNSFCRLFNVRLILLTYATLNMNRIQCACTSSTLEMWAKKSYKLQSALLVGFWCPWAKIPPRASLICTRSYATMRLNNVENCISIFQILDHIRFFSN
jgi:hypothetical protein